MKLEDYKHNTKTIDLTDIAKNIQELAISNDVNFNDIVQSNYLKSPKEYVIPTDTGNMVTTGLLKHKEVGVAITTARAGTNFENHIHEEVEIIKVLTGEIHITVDTEPTHILKDDDILLIRSHIVHDAHFIKDTKFLAITLPTCETWPEVGEF